MVEFHSHSTAGLLSIKFLLTMLVIGMKGGRPGVMFCVKPEEMEKCLDPCKAHTCHSLMYYVNHSNFTTDNATFLFLTGEHSLYKSVYVVNVTNLTLTGEEENSLNTTVQCKKYTSKSSIHAGFYFINITNLKIKKLRLFKCSKYSGYFRDYIALEMHWIHNLTMNDVTIANTSGVGLLLNGLYGTSLIENTTIRSSHKTYHTYGQNLALYCKDSSHDNDIMLNTVLINNSHFLDGYNIMHNYKGRASGVYVQIACRTRMNITLNHVCIVGNKANAGGNIGIQYISHSADWLVTISILNSNITHGYGGIGGGLYFNALRSPNNRENNMQSCGNTITDMPILTVNHTNFYMNKSPYLGAGVNIRLRETMEPMVGKISFHNCQFSGSNLSQNFGMGHGGVAVHIRSFQLPVYRRHTSPLFKLEFTNCNFTENVAQPVKNSNQAQFSLPSHNGVLYVQGVDNVTLQQCNFSNNKCTGIIAIQSFLLFYDLNIIHNNSGIRGGGMVLCARSMMQLHDGTTLNITGNNASEYGGGIYVESECDQDIPHCFFQVDNADATNSTLNKTKVFLKNNAAMLAGSAIYGGMIDHCVIFTNITQTYAHNASSAIFNATFHIEPQEGSSSIISSDPINVCFCSKRRYADGCMNNLTITKRIVPGSTFRVHVMLLGQRYSCVPGVVKANIHCQKCQGCQDCYIRSNQKIRETERCTNCTELTFTVFSCENTTGVLQLMAEGSNFEYTGGKYHPTEIKIYIEKCPLGSNASNGRCKYLYGDEDIIHTICREPPLWIGYRKQPGNETETTSIIFHRYCPLGYCREEVIHIRTTNQSFDQDAQCAHNRSGLLCGGCRTNYSLGFGSSQCLQCRNKVLPTVRVIGLIAVCAVAGVLLVVLLTLLNLTVAEGTLNGLIFYANIIQVNLDIFFPPETKARPLTAFIAWLNLDFGFTVCFYDGMDAYAKTWLQFLFPLYIWVISGAIVYFSRKSSIVASLAGRNAVKVLATLFLLSFGKLLRTIIATISVTNVMSYNGHIDISVWLPDANIHYLHGKHITLYVFAVLAAVVTLLYTLTLTFIQCLRRAPNNRVCVWVRKLKPLLDAYTGPYKDRYHFWTGLLLLIRIFLFVSFAFNLIIGPTLNFSLIITVSTLLMIAIQPGVYRHQLVGLLESSMYVNLILFSTVMMFSIGSYTSYKIIAAYVFGGWALLTFLGIVTYHAYKQLFGVPNCSQLRVWCLEKQRRRAHRVMVVQPVSIQKDDSDESEESEGEREMVNPSWNTPHFREPLIGSMQ